VFLGAGMTLGDCRSRPPGSLAGLSMLEHALKRLVLGPLSTTSCKA
jgi:hypothetical protein